VWWQTSCERAQGQEGFCVSRIWHYAWVKECYVATRWSRLQPTPVQRRWVVMDTRPPLVKPRCPCFIRPPTGSPALLISRFRQLAPRPSSTSHWPLLLNPVQSRSSPLLTDGYMGGLRLQGSGKPVNDLWISRSDAKIKGREKAVECFSQCVVLIKMGECRAWAMGLSLLTRHDDFYMMKSNIDISPGLESSLFYPVQNHSSSVTIISSNDIPQVTSCLYKSHGGSATKSDNYMKYT